MRWKYWAIVIGGVVKEAAVRHSLSFLYFAGLSFSMLCTTLTCLLYFWPFLNRIRWYIYKLSLLTSLVTYFSLLLQTYGTPSLYADYWSCIFHDDLFMKGFYCSLFIRGHVRTVILFPLFLDDILAFAIYHLNYMIKTAPGYVKMFRPVHMFILLRKYKIFYVIVSLEIAIFPYLLIETIYRREVLAVGICIAYAHFLLMRSANDLVLNVWSAIRRGVHIYILPKWYIPATVKLVADIVEGMVISFSYYNEDD